MLIIGVFFNVCDQINLMWIVVQFDKFVIFNLNGIKKRCIILAAFMLENNWITNVKTTEIMSFIISFLNLILCYRGHFEGYMHLFQWTNIVLYQI